METFFQWLSNPGPGEELLVGIIFLFLLVFIFLILFLILTKGSFKIKDFVWKPNDIHTDMQKKDNNSKDTKKSCETINGSKTSIIVSQDYRIISLIVQSHCSRIRDEMRSYCIKNGLNKKDKDEYMLYVDEKKNLYITELKEMINHEYMSYDVLTLMDIYEIIDELKDSIMSKLEKVYLKIRDISINEHEKLEEMENTLKFKYYTKISEFNNKTFSSFEEKEKQLKHIIERCSEEFENLSIKERNDILDKQMQKIDITKKDLRDLILNKVILVMNEKMV